MGRQVFGRAQESRAPSHITVTWEDRHHHCECPSFFPQLYMLSVVPCAVGHACGLRAQLSKLCPLTTFCALPQPTGRWSDTRSRKGLFSAQIQNSPILATVKKVSSIPKPAKKCSSFSVTQTCPSPAQSEGWCSSEAPCVVVPCCCLSALPSERNFSMDGSKP